jgi:hypothetical protein
MQICVTDQTRYPHTMLPRVDIGSRDSACDEVVVSIGG